MLPVKGLTQQAEIHIVQIAEVGHVLFIAILPFNHLSSLSYMIRSELAMANYELSRTTEDCVFPLRDHSCKERASCSLDRSEEQCYYLVSKI